MIISLVVAATLNNVIGKDNALLWHLPNDMAFFKNTTWGMPVIMGRKTYESMGKPLKGRTNIVITRSGKLNDQPEDIVVVPSFEKALAAADETDANECYVIGGGEIFRIAMPLAHMIYMTRVKTELEGDTFFPDINRNEWDLVTSASFETDARHAYPYTFETWKRK